MSSSPASAPDLTPLEKAQLRARTPYDEMVDAALDAIHRGYQVIPIQPFVKKPLFGGWQHTRWENPAEVTREQFVERLETAWGFKPGEPLNLGTILGPDSGRLVDIDIDHPKAKRFRDLLPRTKARGGRPGSPDSHFWYTIAPLNPGEPPTPSTRRYTLTDKSTVTIEYRYDRGVQTVFPPSDWVPKDWDAMGRAPQLIEVREWGIHGPWGGPEGPTEVQGSELALSVALIALATALLDVWPSAGQRHEAYLALGGSLLRMADGVVHPFWERNAEVLIAALAEADGDDDGADSRVSETIPSTIDKIRNGKLVYGFPHLADIIGDDATAHIRSLVQEVESLAGFQSRQASGPATPTIPTPKAPASGLAGGNLPPTPPQPPAPFTAAAGSGAVPGATPEAADGQPAAPAPGDDGAPLDPEPSEVAAAEAAEEAIALSSWAPYDLDPYISGQYVPVQPTLLRRDDGRYLLYPGRLNMLFAPSESAKTMIALYVCREQMDLGERVVFIDFEDEPTNTIMRLRAMGATDDQLRYQFSYIRPDGPIATMERDRWGHATPSDPGLANAQAFATAIDSIDPTFIVTDGMTSIYGLHSLDSNSSVETEVINGWLRSLTRGERTTVLLIDHMAKAQGKGSMPIGSQHKVSMVQGSLLQAWPTTQPVKGSVGTVELIVLKDRNSEVRRYSAVVNGKAQLAAIVTIDSTQNNGETTIITVAHPDPNAIVNVGQAQPGQQQGTRGGSSPRPQITATQKKQAIADQQKAARIAAVQKLIVSQFDQGVSQVLQSKVFTARVRQAREKVGYSEAEIREQLVILMSDGTVFRQGSSRGPGATFTYQNRYVTSDGVSV